MHAQSLAAGPIAGSRKTTGSGAMYATIQPAEHHIALPRHVMSGKGGKFGLLQSRRKGPFVVCATMLVQRERYGRNSQMACGQRWK